MQPLIHDVVESARSLEAEEKALRVTSSLKDNLVVIEIEDELQLGKTKAIPV
jgi:hypothetical protein